MKYTYQILNLIIAVEAFLFLTSGTHRQKFYQVYSQLTSSQQSDQQLGELIIIVFSVLIFGLVLSTNLFLRIISYCLYAVYVCFQYNVVKNTKPADIAVFLTQIFILVFAIATNMEHFLQEQQSQIKKSRMEESRVKENRSQKDKQGLKQRKQNHKIEGQKKKTK